jgi:cell division protein FtsA
LENKIPGSRIGKVFIGIGGQSVRSEEISISHSLESHGKVTDALMDELKNEIEHQLPTEEDVLDILEPACYLNGQLDPNPVGSVCSMIEAKYPLILARHTLRRDVLETVKAAGLKNGLAGIIVTPLALSDAVLSENDKELGCALIDFGSGVTSVSVYKKGRLLGLRTIPLGANLITRDIAERFGLSEVEAEKLKLEHGCAIADENKSSFISVNTPDKSELRSIDPKSFYEVIMARQYEIIANAEHCLREIVRAENRREADNLGTFLKSGIFITGKAASLPQLDKFIEDCLKVEVRKVSSYRRNIILKRQSPNIAPDYVSIGLLLHGDKNYMNCSAMPAPPPSGRDLFPDIEKVAIEKQTTATSDDNETKDGKKVKVEKWGRNRKKNKEPKEPKEKGGSIMDWIFKDD